jgi:hypothetical protein
LKRVNIAGFDEFNIMSGVSPKLERVSDDPANSEDECWIHETSTKMKQDTRKQPWKVTFGDTVDNRIDNEKDLVTAYGDDDDFSVQKNSVAA